MTKQTFKSLVCLSFFIAISSFSFAQIDPEQNGGAPTPPDFTPYTYSESESYYADCENGTAPLSLMITPNPNCPPDEICIKITSDCVNDDDLAQSLLAMGFEQQIEGGEFTYAVWVSCVSGNQPPFGIPIMIPCNCQVNITVTEFYNSGPCLVEPPLIPYDLLSLNP